MKLFVSVRPRARRTTVERITDGVYDVSVTAPAERGEANAATIVALAEHFGVARSRFTILMGKTLRDKVILLDE
jgi:hypothetical protein